MSVILSKEIDLTALLRGTSLPPDPADADFVTAALILDCHCRLGEGVIFDDRKHTVLWTDIDNSQFHTLLLKYQEPTKVVHTIYNLTKPLCSFGMLERHNDDVDDDDVGDDTEPKSGATTTTTTTEIPLLCAWEDGFQLYDIGQQRALSAMSVGETVNPSQQGSRLNDGRVEPNGQRYICGGFYGGGGANSSITMNVYKVEQKQQQQPSSGGSGGRPLLVHEAIVTDIKCANSICWSLDGRTMYLADSPTQHIYSCDYSSETGSVSNKKVWHTKPSTEKSVPDGSCVDVEGYVWNAVWKSGEASSCVQRIDPASGLVVFTVHMPDATSQVTCCCFGGENLDILFVTTASVGLRDPSKEAHAGGLYAAKLPFQGRKESRLKFTIPNTTLESELHEG